MYGLIFEWNQTKRPGPRPKPRLQHQSAGGQANRQTNGWTDGRTSTCATCFIVCFNNSWVRYTIDLRLYCDVRVCVCVCGEELPPDSLEIVSLHNGQHNQWVHFKYKSLDLCINKNSPSVQVSCIALFFLWHFLRKVRVNMTNLRPPTHQKNIYSFQKTFLKSGNKPTKKNISI